MLIYISGNYTAPSKMGILENIVRAESFAIQVWEMGHFAFCPHLNTRFFEEKTKLLPDDYIKGDLKFLERCDGILMIPKWETSYGAKIEHDFAKMISIPVYYHIKDIPICQK